MKTFLNIFLFSVLTAAALAQSRKSPDAHNTSAQATEYQIKAAFIFNFIKFTDWPDEKMADSNEIIIGILGDDPFGVLFEPVENKPVKGKKLVVKSFGSFKDFCKDKSPCDDPNTLLKCHVLFVSRSEKKQLDDIMKNVSQSSVLTVGECDGFLDAGGVINFIPSDNKISFEISLTASKKAGVKISSQVLRLAKRLIGQDSAEAD